MAMITVGIDTSRSYNKKNPPGGKVSDVFSFSEGSDEPRKPGRINRQRSSIDLGCDDSSKQVERQMSEPVVPKSEKQEILPQEKPVASEPAPTASGAKTEVSETKSSDKIPTVDSNKSLPKSEPKADEAEVTVPPKASAESSQAQSETKSATIERGNVSTEGVPMPAATESTASAGTSALPCQTNALPVSSESKPDAQTSVTPTPAVSSSSLVAQDAPVASKAAPPTAAPSVNSVISTPEAAPVARSGRRVPPGGHSTGFW